MPECWRVLPLALHYYHSKYLFGINSNVQYHTSYRKCLIAYKILGNFWKALLHRSFLSINAYLFCDKQLEYVISACKNNNEEYILFSRGVQINKHTNTLWLKNKEKSILLLGVSETYSYLSLVVRTLKQYICYECDPAGFNIAVSVSVWKQSHWVPWN